MGNDKWVTFYFEGNLAWGVIDSKDEWQRIKEAYKNESVNVGFAKRNDNNDRLPAFGFYTEYKGKENLFDFAKKNDIDIS